LPVNENPTGTHLRSLLRIFALPKIRSLFESADCISQIESINLVRGASKETIGWRSVELQYSGNSGNLSLPTRAIAYPQ
jgi:hypothetical protein